MPIAAGDLIDPDDLLDAIADIDRRVDNLEGHNPWARVALAAPQTINIITGTPLGFGPGGWDNGPIHSGSSSLLVAPLTGVYAGVLYVVWATDSRGFRRIEVRANGSTVVTSQKVDAEGTDGQDMTIPWEIFLNVGEYVEAVVYYDASGGSPTTLDVNGASMTMKYLGFPV